MNRDEIIEEATQVAHVAIAYRWATVLRALKEDDDYPELLRGVARALADAELLARPLPTRETIARTLDQTGAFCGACPYEPGDFYDNCADCRRVLDRYADAVLDLLKGQEV